MIVLSRLRSRLSYANVIATAALFIALGGTGYAAVTLPRDSVGAREIAARAVGHAELGRSAVRSENVKDGSVGIRDLSGGARAALRGETGPAGPPGAVGPAGATGEQGPSGRDVTALWATVTSFGKRVDGTASSVEHPAPGTYTVRFARSVSGCVYSATVARVLGDPGDPPPSLADVAEADGAVRVRTYLHTGTVQDTGFHLLVVC